MENGEEISVIKLSPCLDSKLTQNDKELFSTRLAIKKFQNLLTEVKQMKFNENLNQREIKIAVVEAALKQLEPYEEIITKAYSQVLAYRAEGQEIPAHRLLTEM